MKKLLMSILTLMCTFVVFGAENPVGFLSDMEGEIQLTRKGTTSKVASSCEMVYNGDILITSKGASGKIIYQDSIFQLMPAARYVVHNVEVKKIDGSKEAEVAPITRGLRGGNSEDTENASTMIVPHMLAETPVAMLTRADDTVVVYSPRNTIFSKTPSIMVGGKTGDVYQVTITADGKTVGNPVSVKRQEIVPLEKFGIKALQPDVMYTLNVSLNGKVVNNPGDCGFYLMDDDERSGIDKKLKSFEKLSAQSAKDFATANVLYSSNCYSEARVLAEKLFLSDPNCKIYDNLRKLTNKNLGIKE